MCRLGYGAVTGGNGTSTGGTSTGGNDSTTDVGNGTSTGGNFYPTDQEQVARVPVSRDVMGRGRGKGSFLVAILEMNDLLTAG